MPKEFESCVRRGGKVRTKVIDSKRYQRICFIDGKAYAGEVKIKKTTKRKISL